MCIGTKKERKKKHKSSRKTHKICGFAIFGSHFDCLTSVFLPSVKEVRLITILNAHLLKKKLPHFFSTAVGIPVSRFALSQNVDSLRNLRKTTTKWKECHSSKIDVGLFEISTFFGYLLAKRRETEQANEQTSERATGLFVSFYFSFFLFFALWWWRRRWWILLLLFCFV